MVETFRRNVWNNSLFVLIDVSTAISEHRQIPDFSKKSGISLPIYLKSAVNRIVNNCSTLVVRLSWSLLILNSDAENHDCSPQV